MSFLPARLPPARYPGRTGHTGAVLGGGRATLTTDELRDYLAEEADWQGLWLRHRQDFWYVAAPLFRSAGIVVDQQMDPVFWVGEAVGGASPRALGAAWDRYLNLGDSDLPRAPKGRLRPGRGWTVRHADPGPVPPRVVAHLGADHVAWLLRQDHPLQVARSRARGGWDANDAEHVAAYDALAAWLQGDDNPPQRGWSAQWEAWFRGLTDVQGRGWGENDFSWDRRVGPLRRVGSFHVRAG